MTSNRRHFLIAASGLAAVGSRLARGEQAHSPTGIYQEVDSINWYCELQGSGPTVILVPSGEGDCGSFAKVAALLAPEFRVLTFDMPGFSRSSDPPNFERYSISQAASEVAALIRTLDLGPAAVYGCSSGGQVALRLASEHSSLIRRAIVHEVAPGAPISRRSSDFSLATQGLSPDSTDQQIVGACKALFRNFMNEDAAAWDALGEEFHRRLERNYVTWVRRYFGLPDMRMPTPDELQRRPVTWTIGGFTEAAAFFNNVVAAQAGGVQVGLLMCKHFPQVSIPEVLADHIREAARF